MPDWHPSPCSSCGTAPVATTRKIRGLCVWCLDPDATSLRCKHCDLDVDRGGFHVAGCCETCHPKLRAQRARSCPACYAWGFFPSLECNGCAGYRQTYPDVTACGTCRRTMPTRDGHCRLCWLQARRLAPDVWGPPGQWLPEVAHTGQQLQFANLRRTLQLALPRWRYRRALGRDETPDRAERPIRPPSTIAWNQRRLLDVPRDFTRFDKARHAQPDNPAIVQARAIAELFAELRGWSVEVRRLTDKGLLVVLSDHREGDTIRHSEIRPLAADRKVNVERVCEVLDEMGVLDDDRPVRFEQWLTSRTERLSPELRADIRAWLRALHYGGPRSRPRSRGTTWGYFNAIKPQLIDWSTRYGSLRPVTTNDIRSALDHLTGWQRPQAHSAMRSLFGFAKRNRLIFQDPTTGVVAGRTPRTLYVPLTEDAYSTAIEAAQDPDQRLMLALTVVHAARRPALQALLLDDIDLPNRRITIGGHTRPLDDLTARAILEHLDWRQQRWPHTGNRHVLITKTTCHETGPVSDYWCHSRFAGTGITLEQIRIDRTLEEATTTGGDARHLAAVFGLSEFGAIHYATSARALLEGAPETPPSAP